MKNHISIQIPSNKTYINAVDDFIKNICKHLNIDSQNIYNILTSVNELIENAIVHAYKNSIGKIEISIYPFETGLRIDVHDWGIPMSYKTYSSVPINSDLSHGFNKIFKLMDIFEYHNLGKRGKVFTIIKYNTIPLNIKEDIEDEENLLKDDIEIKVNDFEIGDEEGIAKLIYKNYGYSYIKDIFYYPKKIAELHGKKFISVVAKDGKKIVGHFAYVKLPDSNIAEIGIVVVDPLYKGRGIMNSMMERLLQKAKDNGLDAVFGEAIMYHIYSQKTNLKYGFVESALMLGKTPADIRIENNKLTKIGKRGSVLVGYKFFTNKERKLYIPQIYHKIITKTYNQSNLSFIELKKEKIKPQPHTFFHYNFDPIANVATIIINKYGKDFKRKLGLMVSQLKAKHIDMIYLYISLESICRIDKVVKIANQLKFFYSGVAYLYQKDKDYLILQLKNSSKIGGKNLVCYSDFCKELYSYIQGDEMRVIG